ncbi:MAG TPA: hypothetical protein VIV11_22135 [Kofleriaceae bacterium]
MERRYGEERSARMPGALWQTIRLGTFTHVYPYTLGQRLPAGESELRIASNAADGTVLVMLIFAPENGANVLHVNLIAVSDSFSMPAQPGFLPEVRRIFDQAGIEIVVDDVYDLTGSPFDRMTDFPAPEAAPDSQFAELARLASRREPSDALNVFFVDALPGGLAGLSLGRPGPPVSTSYYYGVIVRRAALDDVQAHLVAHEIAHFLGLQHIVNVTEAGRIDKDPILDTTLDEPNLMDLGTSLTPGQVFALSRSAMLTTRGEE